MKVTLICPQWKNRGLCSVSAFRVPPLGLFQLASLTPEDWEVEIIDENARDINFSRKTDLVGLTGMTALAPRAYEIATEFKKRGIPTVMGGIHASVMPEEALGYVDSVVVGEADNIWPQVLDDFKRGRQRKIYQPPLPECLDFPAHRRISRVVQFYPSSLLPWHVKFAYIQLQRGCPIGCEFCSVTQFNGKRVRSKSIPYIIKEIEQELEHGCQYFAFVDDDLVADHRFAKELFGALRPLGIRWATQADIRIARDELLGLACAGGMKGVFVGLESINGQTLSASVSRGKGRWRKDYEEAIKRLHDRGVIIEASFIFGFDDEDKDTVQRTVDWAIVQKIDIVQFAILTPLPGTKLFSEMVRQGRILTDDWTRYSATQLVFRSPVWGKEELEAAWRQAYKDFYAYPSIFGRTASNFLQHRTLSRAIGALLVNFEFRRSPELFRGQPTGA